MIDFHSHILPGIDDGSTDMGETINLIKEAANAGFTGLIATSHYMQGYCDCNENDRKQLLNQISEEKKRTGTKLPWVKKEPAPNYPKLYLGSEIYITFEMIELLTSKKASTINNSRYVLFELPMNSKPLFVKEIVYRLQENGYKPIIAHPERYSYVQEDIKYVEELANIGVLFQSNYGSVIGMYGNNAKKTIKNLLKKDLISFLGSDAHKTNQIYHKIPEILKKLSKIIPEQKLEELTTLNAQKVLNNKDL